MPEPSQPSKAVLVTGCSTGIGRATAIRLAEKGWTVYATARKVESIADLEQHGCRLLQLDVTDEESMQAAVAAIEAESGAVGVLVNNAGYSQSGAIESISMDDVRRQFDTNVFGLVRLTPARAARACARQRWGKVVNVSSMGANFTLPRRAASTTRRSTRSRRSATRCASRSAGSASTSSSSSPASSRRASATRPSRRSTSGTDAERALRAVQRQRRDGDPRRLRERPAGQARRRARTTSPRRSSARSRPAGRRSATA